MKTHTLSLGSIATAVALSIGPAAAADTPSKPSILVWSSMDVSSAVYTQYSAVGEGMLHLFGIKLRIVPVGADTARMTLLRNNKASGAVFSANTLFAWKGTEDYAVRAWGPQKLRTIWMVGRQYPASPITTENSGIKVMTDLKGKRVGRYVGSPGLTSLMEANLAFANLTWKDVKAVDVGGYGDCISQMIAGFVDMCHGDAMSSKVLELASSPQGLRWIPMPNTDTDAWARYVKIMPIYFPVQPKFGAGIPSDNTTWYSTSAYPTLYAYAETDEAQVYWATKSVHEGFDRYKDLVKPEMSWWSIDIFLKLPLLVPFHNGTVKYLKEIGRWTPEMDAKQNQLLEQEAKMQAAWKRTVEQAEKDKLSDKQFTEVWLKNLAVVEQQF